jgi:hypothetical protein
MHVTNKQGREIRPNAAEREVITAQPGYSAAQTRYAVLPCRGGVRLYAARGCAWMDASLKDVPELARMVDRNCRF